MKILVACPAYNEAPTIGAVLASIKQIMPDNDLIVVNDGSTDETATVVLQSQARLLSLPCNLGYSNAVETILRYAVQHDYDAVALIDADGQHDPSVLPAMLKEFEARQCSVLIGSRYVAKGSYHGNPIGRQLGMLLFSKVTAALTEKRIFDTTSGMKVIRRDAMHALLGWYFVDFHAEAVTYLMRLGLTVEEYPIVVKEREHGVSMYSLMSHLWYPLSVLLMVFIGLAQSSLTVKTETHK